MRFVRMGSKGAGGVLGELYMRSAVGLMWRYRRNLFDDYFCDGVGFERRARELVESCYPWFWVVVERRSGRVAGVVYLYNAVGKRGKLHSAYVSTCFNRRYWGGFVARAGRLFFRYAFAKLKPVKLFAEVYKHNLLGQRFVDRMGFAFHSYNIGQTLQDGSPADTLTAVLFRLPEDRTRQHKTLAALLGN